MASRCFHRVRLKADTTYEGIVSYLVSAFRRTALAIALVAWSFPAMAQQPSDRARTEALARRAGERLQALQREAERLASQESSLLNDLRKLEIERQLKSE